MSCPFCYNAHVWATEPKTEDDYFDTGLDDTNDASSITIGNSTNGFQLYFNSGNGKPCNIEVCQWKENGYRGGPGWATIGIYYPKFCPECGARMKYVRGEQAWSTDCLKEKTMLRGKEGGKWASHHASTVTFAAHI